MTGQGQGRAQGQGYDVVCEVRTVNNRHLKLHLRATDGIQSLEPKIETLVRAKVRRGSLQMNIQVSGGSVASQATIQTSVVSAYMQQCQELAKQLGVKPVRAISDLLLLPGAVSDPRLALATGEVDAELETAVMAAVDNALDCLNRMRATEGASMAAELHSQLERLGQITEAIANRSPVVIEEYRERLAAKLTKALGEVGAALDDADLVREVLIMADKADIREELVRLRSHYSQFENLLLAPESQGRKLDFLIQELFRETNTIGSKAGDAEIAQRVVDQKTIVEQMRELVQNLE